MMNKMSKAEKVWNAAQSGVIFTGFYLVTLILVGLPAAMYFLSTKTFPKECSIQDHYVGLCSSTVSSTTNLCTTDSSSEFYTLYGPTSGQYPKTLCENACGPFTSMSNNLEPFKYKLYGYQILEWIWKLAFELPYLPWVSIVILTTTAFLSDNTTTTMKQAHEIKNRAIESTIETLENDKRKQEKVLTRLRSQQQAAEDAKLFMSPR